MQCNKSEPLDSFDGPRRTCRKWRVRRRAQEEAAAAAADCDGQGSPQPALPLQPLPPPAETELLCLEVKLRGGATPRTLTVSASALLNAFLGGPLDLVAAVRPGCVLLQADALLLSAAAEELDTSGAALAARWASQLGLPPSCPAAELRSSRKCGRGDGAIIGRSLAVHSVEAGENELRTAMPDAALCIAPGAAARISLPVEWRGEAVHGRLNGHAVALGVEGGSATLAVAEEGLLMAHLASVSGVRARPLLLTRSAAVAAEVASAAPPPDRLALLAAAADPSAPPRLLAAASHAALHAGLLECATALLERLAAAAEEGEWQEGEPADAVTLLHRAAQAGALAAAHAALRFSPAASLARGPGGVTPLHIAASLPTPALAELMLAGDGVAISAWPAIAYASQQPWAAASGARAAATLAAAAAAAGLARSVRPALTPDVAACLAVLHAEDADEGACKAVVKKSSHIVQHSPQDPLPWMMALYILYQSATLNGQAPSAAEVQLAARETEVDLRFLLRCHFGGSLPHIACCSAALFAFAAWRRFDMAASRAAFLTCHLGMLLPLATRTQRLYGEMTGGTFRVALRPAQCAAFVVLGALHSAQACRYLGPHAGVAYVVLRLAGFFSAWQWVVSAFNHWQRLGHVCGLLCILLRALLPRLRLRAKEAKEA